MSSNLGIVESLDPQNSRNKAGTKVRVTRVLGECSLGKGCVTILDFKLLKRCYASEIGLWTGGFAHRRFR